MLKVLMNLSLAGNLLAAYEGIKAELKSLVLRVKPGDQTIIDVSDVQNNALLIKGEANSRWRVVGFVVKREQ